MLPSLLLLTAILPLTLAKTSCTEKANQCLARNLKRPVCGSDNHTYPTRCQLLRARCQDPGLVVIKKGPCSVKDKKVKNSRGNRGRRACGKVERIKFINKLVSLIDVELCRYEEKDDNCVDDEEIKKRAISWKFSTLDTNKDNVLITDDYNGFVNLVKKAVKPQRCAQSFVNICDENKDKNITLTEWSNCLVKKPVVKKNKPKRKLFDELDFERGVALLNSQITPIEEPQTDKKEEPEGSDCQTDRKNVLGEQPEAPHIELFLPECTPDGRYRQVQCYKSTGYCWCVNEDTGKPIPGTSRKDTNPNCDELALPLRPMKGCPDYKKKIFLKELKNFFRVRVTSTGDDKDDKFAAAIFQILDTNKNKVLEKIEMRPFRTLLTSFSHPVKRCGKKFPKYCDVNHDRKISLTEWVNCMDSEKQGVGLTISNRGQRKGPNPLETILKPDDE